VAEALARVEERHRAVVPDDPGLVVEPEIALAPPLDISRQHTDPVGVHAAEVGLHHVAGGRLGGGAAHLHRDQDVDDEAVEACVRDDDRRLGHGDLLRGP